MRIAVGGVITFVLSVAPHAKGQVTESVEVSAEAFSLLTDTVDVRSEFGSKELENVPVPVTRNYQNLLVTVPGLSPPTNQHSISANPSRALMVNANGTTAQAVAVRVDGATTWNSWLPHVSGYVPAGGRPTRTSIPPADSARGMTRFRPPCRSGSWGDT